MASLLLWKVHRNGITKRWKRAPERFYIPIKFGLRGYGYLTESDLPSFSEFFKIEE